MGAEGKGRWEMPGPAGILGQVREDQSGGGFSPTWVLCAQSLLSITSPSLHHPCSCCSTSPPSSCEEKAQVSPGTALPSVHQGTNPKTHTRA